MADIDEKKRKTLMAVRALGYNSLEEYDKAQREGTYDPTAKQLTAAENALGTAKSSNAQIASDQFSVAQRRAVQYGDRALAGISNLTEPDPRAYKGPLQPAAGQGVYTGQKGELYYGSAPTGQAPDIDRKGRAIPGTGVIDARAPLSAAEVRNRNENAEFFASRAGRVTPADTEFASKFKNSAAAARINAYGGTNLGTAAPTAPTVTVGQQLVNQRSRVPESKVLPGSYIMPGYAPNVPVAGPAGYYGTNGKYLGPQYNEEGKVNPLPQGATGLRGASFETAAPGTTAPIQNPSVTVLASNKPLPQVVPEKRIVGYDKYGTPIYG